MWSTKKMNQPIPTKKWRLIRVLLSGSLVLTSSAFAFEFTSGSVTGTWDTTLSYGMGWRLQDPDSVLAAQYATYNDAVLDNHRTSINKNDGNANFDNNSRPFTEVFKITSDVELRYQNYGAFIRANAFYDAVIMQNDTNRATPNLYPNSASCNPQITNTPSDCGFPDEIRDMAGHRVMLLDAYAFGNNNIGDQEINWRVGNMVINWGEALFLQDGINSANPVLLTQLRLPGAEIKEALLPLPMLYGALALTPTLSLEAFYQLAWDATEADPVGTYYSSDDTFAGEGANRVLVSAAPLGASTYNSLVYGTSSSFLTLKRIEDVSAKSQDQFGLALRYSQAETEFGFYFMNYHSHKPVAQATAGVLTGAPAPALAAAHFIDTSTYQLAYGENIQLYGISVSTTVGEASFAAELAYRPNEIILAELGDNLVAYNTIAAACYATYAQSAGAAGCNPAVGAYYGEHLGFVKPGQTAQDWARLQTLNLATSAVYNFGPIIGASGSTGLIEFGLTYVPQAKNKRYASTASQLNIPLADVPAVLQPSLCSAPKLEANSCLSEGPSSDYLDRLAMGYRMILNATYNNAVAGVALTPALRFAHDFHGNTYRGGNYLEGRRAITASLAGLYNQTVEATVAINLFWGAENNNLISDRDNVTMNLKYSF